MMAATRYESKTRYKQWVQRIFLIQTSNLSEQRYGKVMQNWKYIRFKNGPALSQNWKPD
jgi:hypothetical protein